MASATSSHIIHGLSCQLVVTSPQSRRCLLSSSPIAVGQAQVWSPATGAVCGQTGWWRRRSEPRSLLNLHVGYLVDSAHFYPPSLTAGVPLGGFLHGEENAPLPAGAQRTRPLPTPPSAAAVGVQTSWASPRLCPRATQSPPGQSANKTKSSRSGGRPHPPRLQPDFPSSCTAAAGPPGLAAAPWASGSVRLPGPRM